MTATMEQFVLIQYHGAQSPVMVPPSQAAAAIGAGIAVAVENPPALAFPTRKDYGTGNS